MMDNIFMKTDPAGKIADKEKSTERIDGTATIMALYRGLGQKKAVYMMEGESYYCDMVH